MYHYRMFTVSTFLINSSWCSSRGPACRPCTASSWSASSGTRCHASAQTSTTENVQTIMLRILSDVWEHWACKSFSQFSQLIEQWDVCIVSWICYPKSMSPMSSCPLSPTKSGHCAPHKLLSVRRHSLDVRVKILRQNKYNNDLLYVCI